jgi:xanthine dehydrogenase small subunit
MHTRPIRFFHRGQIVEVADAAPTRTVLEWLREDRRCTGTKEGCAEGDCGACTVVLGRLDDAGALQLEPINACIRFLPTLDGMALFSVEDVATAGLPAGATAALHPVQQALVQCHGSQCGFCTPGFVMSMWASYERHQGNGTPPTRQQLADELSGNLCRCTGYRPILDAGERMFEAPARRLDTAPVVAALQQLQADPPLAIDGPAGRFWAPRDVETFATLRVQHPQAQVLAGSTDMGLWVTKQFRALPELLSIGNVRALQQVQHGADGSLLIGAAASLEEAWSALAARHPALRELWLRFAALPLRRSGTMGGNVANGSPIGDAAPALMALGAELLLQRGPHVRRLPLDAFYLGYMRNALEPGEFLRAIAVPAPVPGELVRAYKISKRFDCDISAVCGAFAVRLQDGHVASARFVYGGMAAVVRRAAAAEAAVVGQPWTEATVDVARAALADDFTPLSDMRASADYRRQVAGNLLLRLWHETRPDAPLAGADTSVWHRGEHDEVVA